MGAWGVEAFDNDAANDWAYDLEDAADLNMVAAAIAEVEATAGDYLEQDTACRALAACEVIARMQGRPGYTNAYTEKVDRWVAAHPTTPSTELVARAAACIDRIGGADSELAELWSDSSDAQSWREALSGLRARVTG